MFRLPTKLEFEKLLALPHKWDEERSGFVVTSYNGNELFFRSNGFTGYYWTSTECDDKRAWYLSFIGGEASLSTEYKAFGLRLRFVSDELRPGFIDIGTGIYWSTENYRGDREWVCCWNKAMEIQRSINGEDDASQETKQTDMKNCAIDWEEKRFELIKSILSGSVIALEKYDYDKNHSLVHSAINMADYVIKKLK